MKVIEEAEIFTKEIRCHGCKALLLIEESDIKAGNFAGGYAGETNDWHAYFDCCVCGSTNRVDEFPVHKLRKLKENA
jgi:hypothetical protein